MRPGIEPASSRMPVKFVSTEPRRELQTVCVYILRFAVSKPTVLMSPNRIRCRSQSETMTTSSPRTTQQGALSPVSSAGGGIARADFFQTRGSNPPPSWLVCFHLPARAFARFLTLDGTFHWLFTEPPLFYPAVCFLPVNLYKLMFYGC